MLLFGIWGVFANSGQTKPFELARWVVALDLAHDLVAAPLIITTAWLVGRLAPSALRAPLRWALGSSAVLVVYSWPFLRGYGRNPTVASLLNRNYAEGLALYLVAVWVVAIVWGAVAARKAPPA